MNVEIRNGLRRIFNRHDPIGIYVDDDTNVDEYDPEIKKLIIIFHRSKNKDEFLIELHDVFVDMFDEKIAGSKSRYVLLANEIYDYLSKELK